MNSGKKMKSEGFLAGWMVHPDFTKALQERENLFIDLKN